MTRSIRRLAIIALVSGVGIAAAAQSVDLTASEVVARYVAARGGAARWRRVETLELRGIYAAFSKRSDFTLIRKRGDLYRLDFTLLDAPAVRARDADGPWMQHGLLQPEAGHVADDPYRRQLERESRFPPLLMDHDVKGIAVELLGSGDLDGTPTVDLKITLPDRQEETWYLDSKTFLEVAVDGQVYDHTQFAEPVRQRVFFDDFREVEGLVLPFQVDWEFGARLEAMTVEKVIVNPDIDPARFSPSPKRPGS